MRMQRAWLKAGVWGAVVGSILTMIVGFNWGGWTTSSTAHEVAMKQADGAVTAALIPVCLAGEKADVARAKKLGELTAITSSYDQNQFGIETRWAALPGPAGP